MPLTGRAGARKKGNRCVAYKKPRTATASLVVGKMASSNGKAISFMQAHSDGSRIVVFSMNASTSEENC